MNSVLIAVLALACIFGASLVGMWLRKVLPDQHLTAESKESVRLGMGLVATMTALLLGLLVASAKGSYDTQRSQVIQIAAKIAFLDRVLVTYRSRNCRGTRTSPASSWERYQTHLARQKRSQHADYCERCRVEGNVRLAPTPYPARRRATLAKS